MSKQILRKYLKDVNILRKRAKVLNLSDTEIDKIFIKCFASLKIRDNRNQSKRQRIFAVIFKTSCVLLFLLLFSYILLNVHQPTSSIVLRNVQGLIYPGLKILRYLSIPLVKKFPKLTGKNVN